MAIVLALALVVTVLVWPTDEPGDPVVTFVQPVPADVETEARAAVAAFVERFASRVESASAAPRWCSSTTSPTAMPATSGRRR